MSVRRDQGCQTCAELTTLDLNAELQEARYKQRRAELALSQLKKNTQKYADGYMEKVVKDAELQECTATLNEQTTMLQEYEIHIATMTAQLQDAVDGQKNAKQEVDELREGLKETSRSLEVLRIEHASTLEELLIRQQENSRLMRQYAYAKRATIGMGVELSSPSRRTIETTPEAAEDIAGALKRERHKNQVLRQTTNEWRRELERKQEECAMWRRRASTQDLVHTVTPEENLFRGVLQSAKLSQNLSDRGNRDALAKVEADIEEQVFLLNSDDIQLALQLLDREPHLPVAISHGARVRLRDIWEHKNASSKVSTHRHLSPNSSMSPASSHWL